ncbi:mitochondrial carrier domain-containing protein [Jimgerdemannia flammicorona]|uniref:Mitochondrial carrier domain-containing protein n=1 Tax=Jimgerdemannia flammicorona TaxID=994334 RepID=A0A433QDH5_9FUNG|nr:mitochondrial carrier domain-containing protein [Jimgerdemannia flammicorona]
MSLSVTPPPSDVSTASADPHSYYAETAADRDLRIHKLFASLDRTNSGQLDSESILTGFQKMTHLPARNKYARELLERCDTSQDGVIDYEEFRTYVEEKEKELWNLFTEIDKSGDGRIQPEELEQALKRAGIRCNQEDLGRLMDAMDTDKDGVIDFHEWRDFLLLLPREVNIVEVYQYYQISAQLTQDAEVIIPPTDEAARNAAKYLMAGGIAGAVSRTCTAPFDRLKIFLITQTSKPWVPTDAVKGIIAKSTPKETFKKMPIAQAIRAIYQQGGLRAFFVGNGLNVIKIVPESAIKFYMFETSKSFLARFTNAEDKNSISVSARFVAGGMAGICSQFSIYPLETLKTRIMSTKVQRGDPASGSTLTSKAKSPSLVIVTAKDMYRAGGIRAFWPGLTLGLIGVFPYQALDMGIFETLKIKYLKYMEQQDLMGREQANRAPSVFVLLACGMVSGSVGATSVYPLSMIRTRLQAQGTPGHPQSYTSAFDAVRKTYQTEGVLGFYKGLGPTMFKVVPAVSISYVVYEFSKRTLGIS